jgi:Ca-activated chloride channel family protein
VRFGAIAWLWLLALVPLLGALMAYATWARRRDMARFGDVLLVAGLRDGSPAGWRAARSVLVLVAVALLAVGAARPQHGSRTEVVARRGIDVVVCLDISKSMLARDVAPSRIERAKAELERLLTEEPGDRVAVVLFAGDTMEYPLTTDHEAALRFFRDAHPWEFPVQGTSIGRAITAARDLLRRDPLAARRSRVILLITDGEDLDGDPVAAAREAAGDGVQVFIDAIGSTVPEPIPAYTQDGRMAGYERDSRGEIKQTQFTAQMEQQLRNVATEGHGTYFRPRTGEVGIDAVRRALSRLRRSEVSETQRTVYEELAWVVLGPAFVLLLVASGLLPERVRRRAGQGGAP